MSAEYTPNHVGIGEFLNSGMMEDMISRIADLIRDRAVSLSPVGDPGPPDRDWHPGRYLASWHVRVHRFGGATNDRIEAVVYNDSPEAFWVEYGHRGREPYYTLRRAAHEVRWA